MPEQPDKPSRGLPQDVRRLAVAIMLGAFMVALDMTMVNVALHTLERDFRASVTTIQLQGVGGGMLLPLAQMILAQAAGRSGSDG